MVTEIRNKLSEASSNLQSAQRYLPNITFPYCSPDEIATLDKAISYIFTDMQTRERHEHALSCYQTTYKRAASLKQWLEHVLTTTISRDLFEITEDCKARASELRNERTRLIRLRIKELTGNDLDYDGGTELRGKSQSTLWLQYVSYFTRIGLIVYVSFSLIVYTLYNRY